MDLRNLSQEFIEKVSHIKESDYGDFKRKAGQYLNKFQDQTKENNLDVDFNKIRNEVIFIASEDVEEAREKLINWASSLKL